MHSFILSLMSWLLVRIKALIHIEYLKERLAQHKGYVVLLLSFHKRFLRTYSMPGSQVG